MKKILKSICFSVLAFLFAIGSIFLPITSNNTKSAHADVTQYTNLTFYSSDIIFSQLGNTNLTTNQNWLNGYFSSLLPSNTGGTSNPSDNQWYRWKFKIELYGYVPEMPSLNNPHFIFSAYGNVSESHGTTSSVNNQTTSWIIIGESSNYQSLTPESFYKTTYCGLMSNKSRTILGGAVLPPSSSSDNSNFVHPSLQMISVEIGNYYDFGVYRDFLDSDICSKFTNSNIIVYTDSSDYKYFFFIPLSVVYNPEVDNPSYFTYRKYYTSNALDFSNNDYYSEGVSYGESLGYNNGYNVGYREGSSVGYDNGFEEGRLEGALNANNYSFFGLISAIIDAPVKVLTSLFNFNFLGVNLWAFFTSILTICLIIFVIRKFMAKG